MKEAFRLFKKLVATSAVGIGGIFCIKLVSCEDMRIQNENDVEPRLPGWRWDTNWDKRDPVYRLLTGGVKRAEVGNKSKTSDTEELMKDLDNVTPKHIRNIFLIRHGQYNLKGSTDNERTLTKLGRKQAAATGKRLKLMSNNYDRFIVSDMSRALETAEIIGKEFSRTNENSLDLFERDPMLREGSPIEPAPPSRKWRPELHYYEDGIRIEAAFRKYFHRAEPEQDKESFEVVVCHANVIRYFCWRAIQFHPNRWLHVSLGNASITHIRILPEGGVILMSLGDSSHMPKELLTTS